MRNNTAKKQDHSHAAKRAHLKLVVSQDAAARRQQIAREAEEACHLKGNLNQPDFEEFLSQYGEGKVSDFA